jgi:hypothetical protein
MPVDIRIMAAAAHSLTRGLAKARLCPSSLSNTATDRDMRTAVVSGRADGAADAITDEPTKAKLHEYFEAHPEKYDQEGVMTVRDLVFPTDAEAIGTAQACAPAPAMLVRFHRPGVAAGTPERISVSPPGTR